jgi:hypothetical protein
MVNNHEYFEPGGVVSHHRQSAARHDVEQAFLPAGSGDFPVASSFIKKPFSPSWLH